MGEALQSWLVTLLQTLVLFAPLLVSAALSGVVLRLDLFAALKAPVDAGRTVRGRRLFGDNKTWRGFAVAVAGSVIAVAIQRLLPLPRWVCVVDYRAINPAAFGAAMGLGAMLGELPNSFVKRQLGVPPGKTARGPRRFAFYLWDQLDLLTGAWPLLSAWVRPSPRLVAASVVLALLLHPLVALVGFVIHARDSAR
ncbi:MAG TPA: CDP-archaeol synthase [Polyangiaceae bacterium]|nr:CDP-archaeol synthase [Polyangiaceae bacterium]